MDDPTVVAALAARGYQRVTAVGRDALGGVLYTAHKNEQPMQIAIASLRAGGGQPHGDGFGDDGGFLGPGTVSGGGHAGERFVCGGGDAESMPTRGVC
ncbi:MAG: hypothetical protein ACUVSQ_02295 [Pseudanabaenaceae cyanobacterium]